MLRLLARRLRTSMSAYFTNSLTRPARLGLLASLRGGAFPDRAARGPVAPRKMACRPTAAERILLRFKAINSRTREGRPGCCPFQSGTGMDTKTRDLALLISLSLFCAGVAWILDYLILGSVFFALALAAVALTWIS